MPPEEVERGLTDRTLERGVTIRYPRGAGTPPTQGALLLPEDVERVRSNRLMAHLRLVADRRRDHTRPPRWSTTKPDPSWSPGGDALCRGS